MTLDSKVVSISAHPKFKPIVAPRDRQGNQLKVGDGFINLAGYSGEILKIDGDGFATVSVENYYRPFLVHTNTLQRSVDGRN